MKIIFHFGAHKTASTHLQYNLRLNKDYLNQKGIAYFRFQEIEGLQEKADALAANINQEDFPFEKTKNWIQECLNEEIDGYDCAVISYEGCLGYHDHLTHSEIYPHAAEIIPIYRETLKEHDIIPIYAVRYYDDFLRSTYRQELGHGEISATINTYFNNKNIAEKRWSKIMSLLKKEFSTDLYFFTFEAYKTKWKEITLAILQLTGKTLNEEALSLEATQINTAKPSNYLKFNFTLNRLFGHIPEFKYKKALYYRSRKHIAPLFDNRFGDKFLKNYQKGELKSLVSKDDYEAEIKNLQDKYSILT
ncbi:MAG TPA: hypothetical protein VK021_08175 [Flavobacteriaceae bacterium]|nr:hypothetical protein [Flavobacteriaceae bacterium]